MPVTLVPQTEAARMATILAQSFFRTTCSLLSSSLLSSSQRLQRKGLPQNSHLPSCESGTMKSLQRLHSRHSAEEKVWNPLNSEWWLPKYRENRLFQPGRGEEWQFNFLWQGSHISMCRAHSVMGGELKWARSNGDERNWLVEDKLSDFNTKGY